MDVAGDDLTSVLDSVERVPKSDAWGRQNGIGGDPPNKVYRLTDMSEAVDYRVAGARMAQRRSGELGIIQGGIDDEDPSLYSKPSGALCGKRRMVQHGAVSEEGIRRLKSGESGETKPEPGMDLGGPPGSFVPAASESASVVLAPGGSPLPPVEEKKADDSGKVVERVVYRDRVVEKQVPVPTPFSTWCRRRTKVRVSLPDTDFEVSAIEVCRSANGIVLVMPAGGDAMTFSPRVASRVVISADGVGQVRAVYTGVSFSLPEIDIFGLCFVVPSSVAGDEKTTTKQELKK